MAKLTKWYPGHIKPVRVGVYQRYYYVISSAFYCLWDGNTWHDFATTPEKALLNSRVSNGHELCWRGLASDPEKGGK